MRHRFASALRCWAQRLDPAPPLVPTITISTTMDRIQIARAVERSLEDLRRLRGWG